MTERDASEAVAGFAVDTFVEPVTSEATAVVDDVAADEVGAELVALDEAGAVEAGAELVALVEAGASELTATLDATELVGATDVAVTVSVAAGATVAVAALSGAVLGEVVTLTCTYSCSYNCCSIRCRFIRLSCVTNHDQSTKQDRADSDIQFTNRETTLLTKDIFTHISS